MKTIGIVDVAALSASAAGALLDSDHSDPATDEIGCHGGYPIILTFRPAVFDREILTLDISDGFQAVMEGGAGAW